MAKLLSFSRTIENGLRAVLDLMALVAFGYALLGTSALSFAAPTGVKGWPNGATIFSSPEDACRDQWQDAGMDNGYSRFIGADDTEFWWAKSCRWTTFQYLCPLETGGGLVNCQTILPADVYFECEPGYSRTFPYRCVKGDNSAERPRETGFFPLISYDVRKNDLAYLSYFSTIWADSKYLFICLETNKVPFDTCLLANLRNGVEVLSLVRAPFVECRFELVACDGTTHRVINAIHW